MPDTRTPAARRDHPLYGSHVQAAQHIHDQALDYVNEHGFDPHLGAWPDRAETRLYRAEHPSPPAFNGRVINPGASAAHRRAK